MSDKKNLWPAVVAVGVAAFSMAAAPAARAGSVTFPLTICDFSGGTGCSAPGTSYGSVVVTDITNGVQVSLNLTPDVFNIPNGQNSAGQPILFDLLSGTVANITGSSQDPSGVSFTAGGSINNPHPMHDNGTGFWTNWISCTGTGCGSGASSAIPAVLSFQVLGSGISTSNLASVFGPNTPNSSSNPTLYFATDIGLPSGPTGDVGAPASAVPLPPSAALLGSALVLCGLLLARRGRRASFAAARLAA